MINIFDATQGAYTNIVLTGAILRSPNFYNRISRAGIFSPVPITKKTFAMDELMEQLYMLNPIPANGVVPVMGVAKRSAVAFQTERYALDAIIRPDEVQGVRGIGVETDETLANVLARKLGRQRMYFDLTAEYLRMGCIKGRVYNPDGTLVYDYFSAFNVTPKVVSFELDQSGTEVAGICRDVSRYVEDSLEGEVMTGLDCYCSATFWEALVTHTSVKENFLNVIRSQNPGMEDLRLVGFVHQNIRFMEYRGTAKAPDGTVRPFITEGEAHIVPTGTSAFAEVYSPPLVMDRINTPGEYLYSSSMVMDFGAGLQLRAETNILPVLRSPKILVKATLT